VRLSGEEGAEARLADLKAIGPGLVLVFASARHLAEPWLARVLARTFPEARRVGCSSAGEISHEGVSAGSVVVTAVRLDAGQFRVASASLAGMDDSRAAGHRLADQLDGPELRAVTVFGQGVHINGSALVAGMNEVLPPNVPITGGLAGDDGAFQRTYTLLDDAVSSDGIVAVGFYGSRLRFGHGCFGGWEPFGVTRKITRAQGNVLYELDGEPALDLYKRYLGEYAKDLPASGLLYPFELLDGAKSEVGLIRTILGVDEAQRSLTLAGDLVDGGYLRLMHASTNRLVEGAEAAAQAARDMLSQGEPGLVLLVSCVGRRLVMGGRVDEEVEAVADVFGSHAELTGFYSYGEFSPYFAAPECKLHNQTMTVTCLSEAA